MSRPWPPAAAALILLAVTGGCNPRPHRLSSLGASATPLAAGNPVPPLRIIGRGTAHHPVRIVEQRGNRKLYQLLAASYDSRSSASVTQATFHDARVTFYARNGQTLLARAPIATVDDRREQVNLSGGVHGRSSSGETLTCDRLTYDRKTGLLHGEGNVRITGAQGGSKTTLSGNSFESDVTLTQMRMR